MEAALELQSLLQGKGTGAPITADVNVTQKGEENYVPVTKETVCYIVCGILFNDRGEILMMQEAKTSCFGMWYLPAGRMELNETIEEAVKREVLEETGIKFQPMTLLSIQVNSGSWYRFTFTGHITGGTLKTTAHKDKESLQAKWCSPELIKSGSKGFPLRANDILPLIDQAIQHRADTAHHPDLMPVISPQYHLSLRVVFIHAKPDGSDMHMLICQDPHVHFPVGTISTRDLSLQCTIMQMIQVILGQISLHTKIHGILALEHSGKPARVNDGLCLSILISLMTKDNELPEIRSTKYVWCVMTGDLCTDVKMRCQPGKLVLLL